MRKVLAFSILFGFWQAINVGHSSCTVLESVNTLGTGTTAQEAFSIAISRAVAQVKGLFVSVEERLQEVVLSAVKESQTSVESTSAYQLDVTSRLTGLLKRVEFLKEGKNDSGLYFVEVRAEVCKDPGLVIIGFPKLLGPMRELLPQWIKLYTISEPVSLKDTLIQTLVLGATHYVVVALKLHPSPGSLDPPGLTTFAGQVEVSLRDVRTTEILDYSSIPVRVAARSRDDAEAKIGEQLAETLATRWIGIFKAETPIPAKPSPLRLEISNLKRSGNVGLVLQEIQKIPGFLTIKDRVYNNAEFILSLVLEVDAATDTCRFVTRFLERIRDYVEGQIISCNASLARIKILRE